MIAQHITDRAKLHRMLFLWDIKHLGTDKIAADLGVSEATVYNTLAHCRARLSRAPSAEVPA